jgi:hypothetical protein
MWTKNEKDQEVLIWSGSNGPYTVVPVSEAKREISRAKYRPDIQDAADQAGIIFRVKREIRELETHLMPDERVLAMVPTTHKDERGLLVATNSRILFIFHGWVNKTTLIYDYRLISKMRWLGGIVQGRMRIYIYGTTASVKFTGVWSPVGKAFVEAVTRITSRMNNVTRDQYEMSLLIQNLPKPEYQIRANDILADQVVALDAQFADGAIEREKYLIAKLELLQKMT